MKSPCRADKLYYVWTNIKQRTSNQKCRLYADYGERGIRMNKEWFDSYNDFWLDVITLPKLGNTLERIDNNGHYEPGNVRWATMKEQARNRRSSRRIEFHGESLLLCEWSERTGISSALLGHRLGKLGWSAERALTTPVRKQQTGLAA